MDWVWLCFKMLLLWNVRSSATSGFEWISNISSRSLNRHGSFALLSLQRSNDSESRFLGPRGWLKHTSPSYMQISLWRKQTLDNDWTALDFNLSPAVQDAAAMFVSLQGAQPPQLDAGGGGRFVDQTYMRVDRCIFCRPAGGKLAGKQWKRMGAKLLDERVTGVRTFLPACLQTLTLTVQLPVQITSYQLTPVGQAAEPVQSDSVVLVLPIVKIVVWICVATKIFFGV